MPFENVKCEKMWKKTWFVCLFFFTIAFAEAATTGVL